MAVAVVSLWWSSTCAPVRALPYKGRPLGRLATRQLSLRVFVARTKLRKGKRTVEGRRPDGRGRDRSECRVDRDDAYSGRNCGRRQRTTHADGVQKGDDGHDDHGHMSHRMELSKVRGEGQSRARRPSKPEVLHELRTNECTRAGRRLTSARAPLNEVVCGERRRRSSADNTKGV